MVQFVICPQVLGQNFSPSFEAQTLDDGVEIGYGLAIGDVDGDGQDDILLADKNVFVWYRNPDWQRFVMVENLTEHDNVCIAAEDINGDGQVEVAVGAQWNPGETNDLRQSGSVHYLVRPEDPTQKWDAIELPHEVTIHRMQWVKNSIEDYELVVLPLHGQGNKDGQGDGVKVMAYQMPADPKDSWKTTTLDQTMHLTHNFTADEGEGKTKLYVGGAEGLSLITHANGEWLTQEIKREEQVGKEQGIGEIRLGNLTNDQTFIAAIEPMHGNKLVVYPSEGENKKQVLYEDFNQGHALACADLLGLGYDQILAGWRNPNSEDKVGIYLFVPVNGSAENWEQYLIDDNNMACEDLKVADLNGDGRLDIVAAGRATNNLIIYWNEPGK